MIPSFAAPAFAWLLLLGVPIVIFHMRRRRTISVPSVYLFVANAAPGAPADHRWARPQWSVPLALQLLFLVLLTAAAMSPRWVVEAGRSHQVLVLDASASMRTVDVDGSRFDAAKADLLQSVDALGDGAIVSVVVASPVPRFLAVRSTDRESVRDAVRAVSVTDGWADWARVATMVAGLRRADPTARATVLSDPAGVDEARSAFASWGEAAVPAAVAYGGLAPNVAITSVFAVDEAVSADGSRWEVRVEGTLAGYGGVDWRGTVEVRDASSGTLLSEVDTAVRSGEAVRFRLDVALGGPTELLVGVAGGDVLAADDRATLIVGGPRNVDVLVIAPESDDGSVWAEALRAVPGTNVAEASVPPADLDRFGLVVADRVALPVAPRTSVVRAGVPQDGALDEAAIELVPTDWLEHHRLSDGVDWRALEVVDGVDLPHRAGGEVVVGASGRPIVQLRVTELGLDVDVAFGSEGSNAFDTSIGPTLVANLVRMVEPNVGRIVDEPCRVGVPCAVPVRTLLLGTQGVDADGRSVALPLSFAEEGSQAASTGVRRFPSGTAVTFVPLVAGVVQFGGGGGDATGLRVAVHPHAWPEADLGVGSVDPGTLTTLPTAAARTAPWRWFVAAALVVLIGEGVGALRAMGGGVGQGRRRPLAGAAVAFAAVFLVLGWAEVSVPKWTVDGALVRIVERRATDVPADDGVDPRVSATNADRMVGRFEVGVAGPFGADSNGVEVGALDGRWAALDLEAAIDAAIAIAPPGVPLRIEVVASGAETQGSVLRRIPEWAASGAVVDVAAPIAPLVGDARILDVFVPRSVHEGVPFPLELVLEVEGEATVLLSIDRNGEPWLEERIGLPAGRSRIAVEALEPTAGTAVYSAALAVAGDPVRANDVGGVVVGVARAPEVAIVTEEIGWAMLMGQALEVQGVDVTYLDPRAMAMGVGAWLPFDVVVLHDVPAIALHTRQQESLTEWVRTQGGGLLVLGGEHAYGPGGYYGTPLERLSPLSSLIPRERADVAVAFVIDRSGSMQQAVGATSRLDIAREATWEAVQLLDERSEVVLVVFDSYSTLLHPLGAVDRIDQIRSSLDLLAAGGGTSIYPALVQAFGELSRSEASQRHIVLLTDGLSQAGDFEGIMRDISGAGITLSAISAGIGSAYERLQRLVELGNGTYYDTNDFQAVPGIMSQEMLLLTSDPIEEGDFVPTWAERGNGIVSMWPEVVPTLEGLVRTTAKPGATVHLVGPDELPVFASWRFGAGRVAAFAGQGAGPWDLEWVARPEYPSLWASVVRQLDARVTSPGLDVAARARGDTIAVVADLLDEEGRPVSGATLRARLLAPGDGSTHDVALVERSAGRYGADVPVEATGPFVVEVSGARGSVEASEAFAFRPYPAALRFAPREGVLHDLARSTGGRVGGPLEATPVGEAAWRGVRDRIPWLMLAAVAFIASLALRYIRAKRG